MPRARRSMRVMAAAAVCGLALGLSGSGAAGQAPPPVNRDAQLVVEFTKLADQYVALHQKLETTLPPRPATPTIAAIEAHEQALGKLIRQHRSGAQEGDVFTRDVRAYFRRQLARALAGPDGRQLRGSIMDENPGQVQITVNGRYPHVPLSTVPPQVLAALPNLPPDLEYRFIARRLILLDVHANIVVDVINDALPR